jgi:hypothetical protein
MKNVKGSATNYTINVGTVSVPLRGNGYEKRRNERVCHHTTGNN